MINDDIKNLYKEFQNAKENHEIIKYLNPGKLLKINSPKSSNIKLINLKSMSETNSFKKEADETYKNFINIPIKEKNISFLTIRNNFANLKRPNIPLPNINKIKIKRPTKSLERDKNISCNNIKTPKLIKKLSINNKENFTFFQQDKINIKEENKEKNNADNVKMIFNHKTLNSTNNNKFMRIHKTLKFQKYTKNFEDTSASELIFTKNIASLNTPSSRIIHPILGLNKLSNNIFRSNSNSHKKLKKNISMPIHDIKEFKESKERAEKLNLLNNIFKTIGNTSPLNFTGFIPFKKEIKLSSEIFRNNYKNFQESIISNKDDFSKFDIIKGYAYNTNKGNIRSYNEDEICISKLYFNDVNKENNKNDLNKHFCHFFAIYDGHGGKGCSLFLKENLHKLIKEFSPIGIKIGIDLAEEKFKNSIALDEKGNLKDKSGSCGIMLMIKGKKCIIANIGDSRLVIFRNKNIYFTTTDHKPDSVIEKARIELSGGKLYKVKALLPVYQNGVKIKTPWRILPGRLSVSRTFGDILAKDEKFGGNKTAIIALPDINEMELNNEYNFIVMGCDGIFDVLKNEELLECIQIVIKEKKIKNFKDVDMHKLCGDFASMIIKSALAKDSFDNVSCIVIAINLQPCLI